MHDNNKIRFIQEDIYISLTVNKTDHIHISKISSKYSEIS